MPVTIKIDTSARTVFSTFVGVINEAEVRSVPVELVKRPDFDPAFSHIIDFSGVTAASVSTNFVRAFAREKPLFRRDARQIIVATQPHFFALSRMLQILREAQLPNIEVVRSLQEAYILLGLPRR